MSMSRKDSVAYRLAREIKPVWLRVPTAVQQTGICQAKLYQWIKDGRIRSAHIREPNKTRGIRVIDAESLNEFIESMAVGGETK
jgi:predicted DNA-binding transcriptional regulator AlpA